MSLFAQMRSIAAGLLRRQRIEASMQDEIRFHIEAYTDDLVRSGVPRPEAERRARIEFGGFAPVREHIRHALRLPFLHLLFPPLRFANLILPPHPASPALPIAASHPP